MSQDAHNQPTHPGEILVRGYFEARNAGDDGASFLAPGFVRHSPPELAGIDDYKAWLRRLRTMWAEEVWRIIALATDGDRVWAWLTNESTHVGTWHGLPPTGRRVTFETVNIFRIRGEEISEMWRISDDWTRFRQLGGEIAWPQP